LAIPTRLTASAPKACDRAVRWGMAVIGVQMAMIAPATDPIDRPTKIQV
jgi:hypothetical protein